YLPSVIVFQTGGCGSATSPMAARACAHAKDSGANAATTTAIALQSRTNIVLSLACVHLLVTRGDESACDRRHQSRESAHGETRCLKTNGLEIDCGRSRRRVRAPERDAARGQIAVEQHLAVEPMKPHRRAQRVLAARDRRQRDAAAAGAEDDRRHHDMEAVEA